MSVEIVLYDEVCEILDMGKKAKEFKEYERVIRSEYELSSRTDFLIHLIKMMYGSHDKRVLRRYPDIYDYVREDTYSYLVTVPFKFTKESAESCIIYMNSDISNCDIIQELKSVYVEDFDVIGICYEDLVQEVYMLFVRISNILFLEATLDKEVRYVIYNNEGDLICIPLIR